MQGQLHAWEKTVPMEQVYIKGRLALPEGLPQGCRAAVNQHGSRLAVRFHGQYSTVGIAFLKYLLPLVMEQGI